MMHFISMIWVVLIAGSLGCGFEPYEKQKNEESKIVCTSDAKMICRESSPGVYTPATVGRVAPGCLFRSYDDEVDNQYCEPCRDQIGELQGLLRDANFCETVADCKYSSYPSSCEFGCGRFHNRDVDFESLLPQMEEVAEQGCSENCGIQCSPLENTREVRCENSLCVLYR